MDLIVPALSAAAAGGVAWLGNYRQTRKYPYAPPGRHKDRFHGKWVVPDPFRWLEEPSTRRDLWMDRQGEIADRELAKGASERASYEERVLKMYDCPRTYSPDQIAEDLWVFYRNPGLSHHAVLFKTTDLSALNDSEAGTVLLDPNAFSEDGSISVGLTCFSQDARLLAYTTSESGSDWKTIRIRDVESCEDLEDTLDWCKFTSIAWLEDGSGFFYLRYPAQEENADLGTETVDLSEHTVFFHQLGTSQGADTQVLTAGDFGDPRCILSVETSDCGRYVLFYASKSCDPEVKLYFLDLGLEKTYSPPSSASASSSASSSHIVHFVDEMLASLSYVANKGSVFFFKTNLDAPMYRVIALDFEDVSPGPLARAKQVIAEDAQSPLEFVGCVGGDRFVARYICDCIHVLKVFAVDAKHGKHGKGLQVSASELSRVHDGLPDHGLGCIRAISCDSRFSTFYFLFESWLRPSVAFECRDCETLAELTRIQVPEYDADLFDTEQKTYESADGQTVRLFVIHRKGLARDGTHPTVLYGYGGFNIPILPSFSREKAAWIDNFDGVFAVANLRGGGEYGDQWHKDGTLGKKQNVFDDLHGAAEFLVAQGYTAPEHLAIMGGSNGGLLVGACANQRPDLYACAIAYVPVMDMLRFHKFTVGYAWCDDYGCADNPDHFEFLYKYSPYHTIKEPPQGVQYPATMVLTADHDDRVVPLHSFKFVAQLQHTVGASDKQEKPLIIRIDRKAGHGAGKPLRQRIRESADVYSFAARHTGAKWTE